MVLSMLATPFIILYTNSIVSKLVSSDWLLQAVQMTRIASQAMNVDQHVIICGYGRCGPATAAAGRIWPACSKAKASPTSRSILTRIGCARPRLPGIRWSLATPPACRH